MNFRNNINYFKKKDSMKGIGAGLLIVGLFFLWLGIGYLGWIAWIFMMIAIPAGFLMFIVGSVISSTESDIDEDIEKKCEGIELDFENDKDFCKRILKNIAPNVAQGYEYKGEGLMFRRDKSGSWRSSKYTKYVIYALSDALYINSRTISLISEDVENRSFEVPYDMVDSIEIKKEENTIQVGKNSFSVKKSRFVIKYGEGFTFSAPMNDDIKSEEFVDTLNKFVVKAKKAKE